MPLSEQAINLMRKANWSEDYRWPVEGDEVELRALGHTLHKPARDFLRLYGGLIFTRVSPYSSDPVMCHTNAVEAAIRLHVSHLPPLEQEAGSKLSPLGQEGYGSFILVMDEEGRVYGVDDTLRLWEFAESGEGWLETCATAGASRCRRSTGVRSEIPSRRPAARSCYRVYCDA